jgi:predicted phosphodiesterase
MWAALWAAAAALEPPIVKGPYLTGPRVDGVTVRFETARPADARVVYATADEPEREVISATASSHAVHLTGLRAGTRYRYRVDVGPARGQELGFRTAPPAGAPFSFVVMGDTRSAEADHRAVIARLAGEAPDLIVHTGDLVADGAEEAGWQSFFAVQQPLLARAPIAPAVGNHEAQNQLGLQNFTRYFGVAARDGEMRHSFTFGNARFVVMDTNVMFFALGAQTGWLEGELRAVAADPDVRHIFVVLHHGPFSTGPHGGNLAVRAAWAPLFSAYGVDAVFSGHDHLYERLEHDGVRYVVSGGGGGPLYPRSAQANWEDARASIYTESVHHFVRVQVAGDGVELAAVRADGTLIETHHWRVAGRRVVPPGVALSPPAAPAPRGTSPWLAAAAAGACALLALGVLGWRRRALAVRGR